jgi:hypothetical protein
MADTGHEVTVTNIADNVDGSVIQAGTVHGGINIGKP